MTMDASSERRLIENEVIVKTYNDDAKDALKKYFSPGINIVDEPLDFKCECSNLDCGASVRASISEYESIHKRDDRFMIITSHNIATIEDIVSSGSGYSVVQKHAIKP